MTSSAILDQMSRGWNRDPDHVAQGSERTGMSAALWSSQLDTTIEVTVDPLADQHIVCLQLLPFSADFWQDGGLSYSGAYTPGDVSIVPAGKRPRALMHGKFACLHLYVPDALLNAVAQADGLPMSSGGVEMIDPKRMYDPLIQRIGRDILGEMRTDRSLSRLRVDALGMDLAVQLIRRYSGEGTSEMDRRPPARGGLTPWQMRRCFETLVSNLAHDHAMISLAAEVGLSPFHFARAFRQSFGVPPHAYLTTLRMERVRALLAETDMQVTQIAFEVGYESSQAVARAFRKQFHCSPTQFRRDRSS